MEATAVMVLKISVIASYIDAQGNKQCLLLYSDDALQEHVEKLGFIGAPADLVKAVQNREVLPTYNIQDDSLTSHHPYITDWKSAYQPGVRIGARKNFHAIIIKGDQLPESYRKGIISYSNFLESNSLDREIVH